MNRPNILLITTDQQRFDTISALGNQHIYTPHLNWLCDDGIAFTRCYSDSPICMPARATIMTGKHGYVSGLTGNSGDCKPMTQFETLPGLLTKAGYQTRAQGKMHFEPMRANYGFEHMELPMDYYRERNKNHQLGRPKMHGVGENEVEPVLSTVDEQNSLTTWTVERSIDFLETRDETRPFFLWTSFTKPHPPYDPAPNYWALYQNEPMPEPVLGDWSNEVADIPQGFLKSTYLLNNIHRLSPRQIQNSRRAYYACITQIDYALGLLFARMREMNLLENTWIVFTTDHGDMLGDHHMGAKSVFLEGSAHIPFLVRPPKGSFQQHPMSGKRCDSLIDLADLLPTILAMAGVEAPENLDGENVLHFLENPKERTFFGSCSGEYYAVIEGKMKYLMTPIGMGELLFDLENDPYEQHNLLASPQYAGVLASLRQTCKEYLKKYAPKLVKDGEFVPSPGISGNSDVPRWPGFHSTVADTDVLH